MRIDLDGPIARDAIAQARATWPQIDVPDEAFRQWLAERLRPDGPLGAAVGEINVDDLYLACACQRGDPHAIAAFCAAHGEELRAIHRRFAYLYATADDLEQTVLERMFVGPEAKILGYRGRGALRTWLRVAAVRMLLNETRRAAREIPVGDELFDATEGATDPEEARVRTAYAELLRAAFSEAMTALSVRDTNLLRYAFLDHLSVDRIGALYGVHRATAARWVATARDRLGDAIRKTLVERLRMDPRDVASAVRVALSRTELSLARHFQTKKRTKKKRAGPDGSRGG